MVYIKSKDAEWFLGIKKVAHAAISEKKIIIEYIDEQGNEMEFTAKGLDFELKELKDFIKRQK